MSALFPEGSPQQIQYQRLTSMGGPNAFNLATANTLAQQQIDQQNQAATLKQARRAALDAELLQNGGTANMRANADSRAQLNKLLVAGIADELNFRNKQRGTQKDSLVSKLLGLDDNGKNVGSLASSLMNQQTNPQGAQAVANAYRALAGGPPNESGVPNTPTAASGNNGMVRGPAMSHSPGPGGSGYVPTQNNPPMMRMPQSDIIRSDVNSALQQGWINNNNPLVQGLSSGVIPQNTYDTLGLLRYGLASEALNGQNYQSLRDALINSPATINGYSNGRPLTNNDVNAFSTPPQFQSGDLNNLMPQQFIPQQGT